MRLDAFLGSGTTLIAAERTGRRCYGLELDPAYVDTIIRRWQVLTGGSARHAVSGRRFDKRVSVERIGTALIEAAAMRCGPGGDASRAAFRRPCSVKPGGDTAHDYGASTAEWCTVRPGD